MSFNFPEVRVTPNLLVLPFKYEHRPFKSLLDIFPSSIRTCEKMLGPQIEERAALPADERPVRSLFSEYIFNTNKSPW